MSPEPEPFLEPGSDDLLGEQGGLDEAARRRAAEVERERVEDARVAAATPVDDTDGGAA